ncbi:probable sulfur controller-2 protein [Cephalotrichum gorgonifer]|uniref:Probable sulfur controller-2 protein n=1 Tax=Cephalotrichum gorgonifer TaxID=2041049 RepID=A0AAE8STV9_9PEZI|nr:probable sulfur controller-2 protein [Cephalotrichum gorgonifer]
MSTNDKDNHPSRDNCDRRRHHQPSSSRPAPEIVSRAVTPFLRDHIPGVYAPLGNPEHPDSMENGKSRNKDSNTKFCYRHRPDLKCRRVADESKMAMIQRELDTLPQSDREAVSNFWSLFSASPAKHRNLMLQGVMTQCCFPQLSTIAREVQEQLKIDFMTALPPEISFKILCYLDTLSLCRAAQVSRRWRDLADDDVVWHRMCKQHIDRKCTACGWGLPLLERKRLRDWTRQKALAKRTLTSDIRSLPALPASEEARDEDGRPTKRLRVDSTGADSPAGVVEVAGEAIQVEQKLKFRPFKDVYRDRFKIGYNWKYGRCAIKTFKGHTNGILCLQFDDNVLATGSYDTTIKIWNIETGEEMHTLRGHTSAVRTLQFDGNKLISGSLDNTIKIWNWQTGECVNTLQYHTGGVITLHFEGHWLASGSTDGSIKVSNFETRQIWCARGHEDWVNQVRMDLPSQTLFSASDDCTIKMWDMETKQCIKTYTGHLGQVQQLILLPDDFEPDEALEAIDGVSISSGRATSPPHTAGRCTTPEHDDRAAFGPLFVDHPERPLPPRYMLTAGHDNNIRLWEVATGRCVRTMFGHLEGIWGLAGDTLRFVSGANDSSLKVWDARSGKCERTFTGHAGPVTCVGLSDSRMASASEDGEVRVYIFEGDSHLEEYGTPA